MLVERGFDEPLVMHVRARHRHANWHAATIGEHRPFHAEFATIGRVFPGFFPAQWRLGLCPVQTLPPPGDAPPPIIAFQFDFARADERRRRRPLLKVAMDSAA